MRRPTFFLAAALALGALASTPVLAQGVPHGTPGVAAAPPAVPASLLVPAVAWADDAGGRPAAPVIRVADGCGPGGWRGPWGACHGGWAGPVPGYYAPPPPPPAYYAGNGCPPGFWRGPWGHCRDTPYHGRLPDGGWQ
ncbi:hypothetical protein M0638_08415 [Roseomonas sp. NAR14]|uniref:PXPV repeat-containing protein n=1 Tax=Roseomonas acroporae TaxID=2937791 RepID=A0A9X1Y8U1_9PROT|nr:hypothetical protein [Roseomonas acroporae]MCK8784400.1 hypothetical protein [Roseomonas acroporae]